LDLHPLLDVFVGNGPSGISLSFMLSGWTPTYDPQNVPEDDLLRLRMSCENPDTPITELVSDAYLITSGLTVACIP